MTALALQDDDSIVFRIGYRPDPFAWTPWQYATNGRFQGRWDDSEGRFRTLYVADGLLGCLLEVLADFRPDLTVVAALQDIDGDDDGRYPTAAGGTVPHSWLTPRAAGQAIMNGHFADVSDARTISVLRDVFAGEAVALGLSDIDAAVLKLRAPRTLTQQVAGWMYQLQPPPDGVSFGSRHDDTMRMWAIFEQPGEDENRKPRPHQSTTGRPRCRHSRTAGDLRHLRSGLEPVSRAYRCHPPRTGTPKMQQAACAEHLLQPTA